MTDAVATQALRAASPAFIAALEAFQQFVADMGSNPEAWALNYPGAKLKFLGAVTLQAPALATAEAGAFEQFLNTQTSSLIEKLKQIQAAPQA